MAALLTTDIHLTEDPKEEYRWGLFRWLRRTIIEKEVSDLIILGDLTEKYDNHSGIFVNRVVRNMVKLRDLARVHILRGNHDCTDPKHPFFGFLNELDNVWYYKKPMEYALHLGREQHSLMLPHSRDPSAEFADIKFEKYKYVFMHQTVDGSKAENHANLSGIPRGVFNGVERGVYSGDVHVPQNVGKVTYVGAPYHVHFGDAFIPRVMMLMPEGSTDLHFPTISKHHLRAQSWEDVRAFRPAEGDHVKITMTLPRSHIADWPDMRQKIIRRAEKRGWVLFDVTLTAAATQAEKADNVLRATLTPSQYVKRHAKANKLDEYTTKVGLELL